MSQEVDVKEIESHMKQMSFLFMITIAKAEVVEIKDEEGMNDGIYVKAPSSSHVIVFSDRPNRIAKAVPEGLEGFVNIFKHSDFETDNPNVTFSANLDSNKKEYYSVFEMDEPQIKGDIVFLPIKCKVGDTEDILIGSYINMSLIVDNFWETFWGGASVASGITTTVATGIAAGIGSVGGPVVSGLCAGAVAALGSTLTAAEAAAFVKESDKK